MPLIRHTIRSHWRAVAVVGLAGAAAYVGSRTGCRTTAGHLSQIDTAVSQLALYARRDYWSVYRQVQSDLLDDEEDT
jgi:hypothetical protein